MDWFRVDSDVPRHPAVHALADTLGVSLRDVLGLLTMLWGSVAEHAEDGNLGSVSATCIARWTAFDGNPDVLVAALKSTGWIDANMALIGWAKRHKSMVDARKRKRKQRLGERDKRVTVTHRSQHDAVGHPRDQSEPARASGAPEPYRTGPVTRPDETSTDSSATAEASKPHSPRKRSSAPVNRVIDAYHDAHIAATGAKPLVKGAQAGKLVKDALAVVPLEEMLALVPLYFEAAREPSLSGFLTTWMLEKLRAQYRARSGGAHEPERDGWLPEQRALCAAIKSYADGSLYARASWWPRAAKISVGDDGLWIMLDQRMIHDFAECWRAYDAAGRPEPLGWLKANVALMDKPTYEASVRTPAATGAA